MLWKRLAENAVRSFLKKKVGEPHHLFTYIEGKHDEGKLGFLDDETPGQYFRLDTTATWMV